MRKVPALLTRPTLARQDALFRRFIPSSRKSSTYAPGKTAQEARLPRPALIVHDSKDGAVLTVYVQPKAARTAWVGIHGEALKIRILAPPAGGAANRELVRFLAHDLLLPTAAVHIEFGEGSRLKRVRFEATTGAHVMTRLMRTRASQS